MSWFGSSTRKATIFYVVLVAMASLVVGMVIASRLDLSPVSSAQTLAIPATNSAPLAGPVDATTFRNIAKSQSPMVVSIRTESRQRTQDLAQERGISFRPRNGISAMLRGRVGCHRMLIAGKRPSTKLPASLARWHSE